MTMPLSVTTTPVPIWRSSVLWSGMPSVAISSRGGAGVGVGEGAEDFGEDFGDGLVGALADGAGLLSGAAGAGFALSSPGA